jgi:hypothetical protein
MLRQRLNKMNERTFKSIQWLLTVLSGLLTSGLIFMLES